MKTVAVIDYGMGNIHSVAKALEKVAEDTRVVVSSAPGLVGSGEAIRRNQAPAGGLCRHAGHVRLQ